MENLLLGHKEEGTHLGFAAKELEQTQYDANVVNHQRCLGLKNVRKTEDKLRCLTCVRGVVAVPQRLEVGEDSLEIVGIILVMLFHVEEA